MQSLQQTTGEIPKALKDRPYLTRWTAEYYRAFGALSDSRQMVQGGVGPIPLSEMLAYMEMFGITEPDERERFIKMIKALDRVFVTHTQNRLRREREKAGKQSRSKGKRKR